jgi:hypothetical protein
MPDKPRTPSSRRTYSIGEPGKLTTGFSRSARMGNLNPRDRAFASLSNIADLKSAGDAATEDLDDEFDHIDESHYVDTEDSTKHKKKSLIFRRFGDFFQEEKPLQAEFSASTHTLNLFFFSLPPMDTRL